MDKHFKKAVTKTLQHEGGYVNDPHDPGGETNYGISRRAYPDLDIKALTRNEAKELYFKDYWQKNHYDGIKGCKIAGKVFDLSVNMGAFRANCLLQISVNYAGASICIDGIIGPRTLGAVNGHAAPACILAHLKVEAVRQYIGIGNPRYESGWVKRAIS